MNNKKTAPNWRFRGFTDDWKQRRLGEIFSEKTIRSKNGSEALLSVTGKTGVILTDSLGRKDNSSSDKSRYKLVDVGDIAYNSMRMWQGALGVSSYEGIVSPAYTVLSVKNCNENPAFYAYGFKREKILHVFQKNSQGLTSDTWNLKYPLLKNIKYITTDYKEQNKIVELLLSIDNTINLHEEKLAKLKQLKQGFLQKMFADESGKPALRFKGFYDDWKQRKLNEISEEVRGNDGDIEQLPVLTISAANGWMNQKDRFSQIIAGKELKKYTLLRRGELSYNHGNSKIAKYGTVFAQKSYDKALVPRVYHSFRVTNNNSYLFLEYLFATRKTDRELVRLVTSGARMDGLLNINRSDFFRINIKVSVT